MHERVLTVTGAATIGGNLSVTGQFTSTNLTTTSDGVSGSWNVAVDLVVTGTVAGAAADFDSITVDADAGIDCQAAGTLEIGLVNADEINIGKTTEVITFLGPVNADEAVTFDTTLGVTGILTASSNLAVAVDATVGGTLDVTGTLDGTATGGLLTLITGISDTNVVVNNAINTARYVGDTLVGTVSNLIWVAESTGTSSWILVTN